MLSTSGDSRVTVRVLGAPAVLAGPPSGPDRVIFTLGKPLALVAYLLLAPRRTASRERLADLLWGDQERGTARQAVRRTLSNLRARLGAWAVDGDDTSCTVSPAVACDAVEFSRLIAAGELEEALALYNRDFLADFASPGCNQFETWAEIERAHFRSAAIRAAESLCRTALDAGRISEARRLAARVREIDPFAELGWRLAIEAWIAAGDSVGAIAESARFEEWLRSEGIEPEPASRALIKAAQRSIARTPERGVGITPLAPDLVGREREFREILEAWRKASDGTPQMVTVTGPAGLGKTRLLEAVADRLRSMRKRVVTVRAYAGERSIAYGFAGSVAHELARLPGASGIASSLLPHLVALDARLADQFPDSPAAPIGTSSALARATAVRELLGAVTDDGPVALLLDDLHWCDEASRSVLAGAFARLSAIPLLVVTTSRTAPTGLHIEDRASALDLAPLAVADVGSLVESIGALPSDSEWPAFVITRVAAASRGIPLLVLGALQELVTAGVLGLKDGVWVAPDEPRLRDRLRNINALATRLRLLSDGPFRLLLACSIVGRPLAPATVDAIATGVAPGAALDARAELERVGHFRQSENGVAVAHDAISETALEIADPKMVTEVRRALSRALCDDNDVALVEMGLRFLVGVDESATWSTPLARAVRARMAENNEPMPSLLARMLGASVGDDVVRRAHRALPFALRLRTWRTAIVAGAAAIVFMAATGAAVAWRMDRDRLPALRLSRSIDATRRLVARVPLDDRVWEAGASIEPAEVRETSDSIPLPIHGRWMMPGRNAWVFGMDSPDSGGADVAMVDERHVIHRLTWAHADETPETWSPDGRMVAMNTSQFTGDHRTLALLDVATRSVHPLATDSLAVSAISWSPDGTRIAYGAGAKDNESMLVCIVTVDGRSRRCMPVGTTIRLTAWMNDDHLLVQSSSPNRLHDLDVSTGIMRDLDLTDFEFADLSPDARWLVFTRDDGGRVEVFVSPSDRLDRARRVLTEYRGAHLVTTSWWGPFRAREYLEKVRIGSGNDSIPLGATFQLSAEGVSSAGREMRVVSRQWRSLDTTIAMVDSAGSVTPRRAGRVSIELSAGGWRTTRRDFVVVDRRSAVVLDEDWKQLRASRWVPFGEPFPIVVSDSVLGRAFLNNGDGWYFSGAYTARSYDARRGLALDVTLRTPIARDDEEYLEVGFTTILGVDELRRRWDHRTGYLPSKFRESDGDACVFSYPSGEGPRARFAMRPHAELSNRDERGIPRLAKGDPLKLRVQFFPDGRCGFALEGEPPVMSGLPTRSRDSISVLLQGNSVGTRLLVGHLTLRAGVPPGVDWSNARRTP